MTKKLYEQTGNDLVDDYEGMQVQCPFCAEDDEFYRPYLSLGKCHNCSREFDITIRWEVDENDD